MDIRIGFLLLAVLFILLVLRVTRPPKCTRCGKVVSEFEHDECFGECKTCFLKDVPENGEPVKEGEMLKARKPTQGCRALVPSKCKVCALPCEAAKILMLDGPPRVTRLSTSRIAAYLEDMSTTAEGCAKVIKPWMFRQKFILRCRAQAYRHAAKFFALYRDAIPEAGDCANCKKPVCCQDALTILPEPLYVVKTP